MATGIESLFNLKTPEEYQRDYLTGMMVNPAQMGNQSLYQQIISTMANAGAMGGAGIGRLMGGRTSGEVQRAAVDDVFKTVSQQGYTTESDKYRAAAQLFQEKGMYQEAEQVMAKYRESIKEEQAQQDRDLVKRQGKTRNINRIIYKPVINDFGDKVMQPFNVQVTQEWDDAAGKWVDITGAAAGAEVEDDTIVPPPAADEAKSSDGKPKRSLDANQAKALADWAAKNKPTGSLPTPKTVGAVKDTTKSMLGTISDMLPAGLPFMLGNKAEQRQQKVNQFFSTVKAPPATIKANKWLMTEVLKRAKEAGISEDEVNAYLSAGE